MSSFVCFINLNDLKKVHTHFDLNRKQRKSIRSDIPVAKSLQTTEYAEQLRRHKMLEELWAAMVVWIFEHVVYVSFRVS